MADDSRSYADTSPLSALARARPVPARVNPIIDRDLDVSMASDGQCRGYDA
jgi:hypothetical protein